nr:RNA-directed DNA polymerase, eukaryota [Tanacetum cinerariifolium]
MAIRIYGIYVRHMGILLMLISLIEDRKQVKDLLRFIKVFDVERLVNNPCTVCVGCYKLHANVARFQRESLNKHSNQFDDNGTKRDNVGGRKNGDEAKGIVNSYAHAVKGTQGQKEVMDDIPFLMLDDSCLNHNVYSLYLLGKVKEFASLTNLKVVLAKEGYANIEIKNTFSRTASRWGTLLNGDELEDGGFHRKRICICTNMKTVLFESFKMVYRGKVCWVHAIEVPRWVPGFEDEIEEEYDLDDGSHEDEVKWGDFENLKDLEGDSDVEEVPESKFEEESNKHTLEENSVRQSNAQSKDLFGIYEVLKKKRDDNNKDVIPEVSLKYPPGFTPNEDVDASVEASDILLEKTRENDDQEDGDSEGEVVTMRDFNEVRDNSERFGSVFNKLGAEAFNSFISNAGLVEVPLGGCSFTWCHKSATKMSKLDCFLIYDNLMCSCPSISSTSLDRCLSDHRSILMQEIHYDNVPTPFKFFHYWFEIDGFDKLNKESSNSRKGNLKAELADLDLVIDKGEGADVDVKRRQEIVSLLQEVEKIDSMEVAQKAKIKWAIEGDENSKYYHGVLNKKRGRLAIRGVLVDGIWMESPSLVKNELFDHFKNRFEQPLQNRIQLERGFLNRITTDQNEDLEREVSKEEIKRAMWDCAIDKAPGPDGFTFGFYRRPISLVGSLYKIIAKILANRLVMVLGDLVNEIQSAFVADRQILDGPFILNELVQWCKKKKKQAMIFKWNQCNIDTITRVLEVFHRASGLRINLNKSKLMGISVDISKVEHTAAKIRCLILKTPFTYLGSRVGGLMLRIQSWNDIIESMVSRLSRWKLKTLSIGGRLTLLKSVLGAIPIYHMSIFKVPMKVWRFISQNSSLWASVIKALHGKDGKIGKKIKTSCPSIWLSIIHEVELLKSQRIDLPSFIIPKLGNGVNTSFWDVAWLGDVAFKFLVPRLRNPRGGVEQAQLELLKEKVEGCILSNMNDRWAWSLEGSCEFLVSSVRKVIDATLLPKGTTKIRWIKAVPIKINVHAWKVKHDCLPTRVNISRKGVEIESMLCHMCDNAVESSRHLFFSCYFISELTRKITRW